MIFKLNANDSNLGDSNLSPKTLSNSESIYVRITWSLALFLKLFHPFFTVIWSKLR